MRHSLLGHVRRMNQSGCSCPPSPTTVKTLGGADHKHSNLSFWCMECSDGYVSMDGATTCWQSSIKRGWCSKVWTLTVTCMHEVRKQDITEQNKPTDKFTYLTYISAWHRRPWMMFNNVGSALTGLKPTVRSRIVGTANVTTAQHRCHHNDWAVIKVLRDIFILTLLFFCRLRHYT